MINRQRMTELFMEYVSIGSETGNEKEICERVYQDFKDLGFSVQFDNAGAHPVVNSNGNNVYAYLEGDPELEPILFSSHLDTVTPGNGIKPYVEDGYVYSQPGKILGADCKSGVAAIMEAARAVVEEGVAHRPIEIIFTIHEEGGLAGSGHLELERIHSKHGIVLDASLRSGRIVTNAPGQMRINADIHGKRAHAGARPEQGISAIMAAARAVSNMKLLRVDEETTANIGTLSGIGLTNVVHDQVRFESEARSRNKDKLQAQSQHMVDCLKEACEYYGAQLDLDVYQSYHSYKHADEDPHVQFLMRCCEAAGIQPWLDVAGGATDANNFNRHGIKTIVLSCGMEFEHTTNERCDIQVMEDAARTLYFVMKK